MTITDFIKQIGSRWVKVALKDNNGHRFFIDNATDTDLTNALPLKGEQVELGGDMYFLAVRAKGTQWQRNGNVGITTTHSVQLIPSTRETIDLSDMLA